MRPDMSQSTESIDAKAREIFLLAIEQCSSEAREAVVGYACGSDDELRMVVERLLGSHDELRPYAIEQDATKLPVSIEYSPGQFVGPFKLREKIGEGGMGIVYVADQKEPVKRKVALKIIKPGMASEDIVNRFESERQALAIMDHPNIARVFDGGVTESGQTYFVMELVQGVSVTEYCNEHRFSTEDRLKLFVTICKAVHHAHRKGVIHRDLKPSNIIVAEIDDVAVPKVIDFGVAKAINQSLSNETVYTQFTQMVGTPLYMSPEQAGQGVLDIDTRSDVYSLGVLLYELLTGCTPFGSDTMKQVGFDEMRRIIREDDPPRPSDCLSTVNAQAATTLGGLRTSNFKHLSSSLRGELDWIVMKSLEKDRNRRYESASALADDVEGLTNLQELYLYRKAISKALQTCNRSSLGKMPSRASSQGISKASRTCVRSACGEMTSPVLKQVHFQECKTWSRFFFVTINSPNSISRRQQFTTCSLVGLLLATAFRFQGLWWTRAPSPHSFWTTHNYPLAPLMQSLARQHPSSTCPWSACCLLTSIRAT